MIGLSHFACILIGMFAVLFSQAFMLWGFYRFECWLKSRKGQSKKKYKVVKRKQKSRKV